MLETVLLASKRFSVTDALALGLVDRVAPRAEARAIAEAALTERAALPRRAYATAKRSLRTAAPDPAATSQQFVSAVLPSWVGLVERKA